MRKKNGAERYLIFITIDKSLSISNSHGGREMESFAVVSPFTPLTTKTGEKK